MRRGWMILPLVIIALAVASSATIGWRPLYGATELLHPLYLGACLFLLLGATRRLRRRWNGGSAGACCPACGFAVGPTFFRRPERPNCPECGHPGFGHPCDANLPPAVRRVLLRGGWAEVALGLVGQPLLRADLPPGVFPAVAAALLAAPVAVALHVARRAERAVLP